VAEVEATGDLAPRVEENVRLTLSEVLLKLSILINTVNFEFY
jgi:hypothetical protein